MKVRVKATRVIVNVTHSHNIASGGVVMKKIYKDQLGNEYYDSELEFLQEGEYILNYWTRLEHQYAGQFMQAMISSSDYINMSEEAMADASLRIAHALVEKHKKEEK